MDALKILEVATDAPPSRGGISRIVGIISNELMKRGHIVDIVTPKIRFRELKFSGIPFRLWNNYDIIHLHGPTPFLSDLMLITNFKLPIVYTHHAEICWISEGLSNIYRGFHRFLTRNARVLIVHSYDYARLFKRGNVVVIHIPCPFKPLRGLSIEGKKDKFTVLYVGQFRPFKGIDILIKAASILKDIDFVLVGDGYLKPKLIHMAEGLPNIKFFGGVGDEELIEFYKLAHVICLPSVNTTEAYGLVLIEGALYGCVPLASNLIGVRENIHRLRGLLFELKSCTSLIKKIKMLADDPTLWVNLAERSYKAAVDYVNKYTPDYYVDMHQEIFRDVVDATI